MELDSNPHLIGQFDLNNEMTLGVAFCPLSYLQGPCKVLIFDKEKYFPSLLESIEKV